MNRQEAKGKQGNGVDGSTAPKVSKDRNGDNALRKLRRRAHKVSKNARLQEQKARQAQAFIRFALMSHDLSR